MEDVAVPLNLNATPSAQSVFNAGISVDNMSWWFWIKAGIGLFIGVAIGSAVVMLSWLLVLAFIGLTAGRGLIR